MLKHSPASFTLGMVPKLKGSKRESYPSGNVGSSPFLSLFIPLSLCLPLFIFFFVFGCLCLPICLYLCLSVSLVGSCAVAVLPSHLLEAQKFFWPPVAYTVPEFPVTQEFSRTCQLLSIMFGLGLPFLPPASSVIVFAAQQMEL